MRLRQFENAFAVVGFVVFTLMLLAISLPAGSTEPMTKAFAAAHAPAVHAVVVRHGR